MSLLALRFIRAGGESNNSNIVEKIRPARKKQTFLSEPSAPFLSLCNNDLRDSLQILGLGQQVARMQVENNGNRMREAWERGP